MGNYGIKVTEPGNAVTETSPGKYRYHSSYPLLKIKSTHSGYTQTTGLSEALILQVTHSLGYSPMFDAMVGINSTTTSPSTWYPLSFYSLYPTLGWLEYVNAYSDSTYFYLKFKHGDTGTRYIHYKAVIYYDPINP